MSCAQLLTCSKLRSAESWTLNWHHVHLRPSGDLDGKVAHLLHESPRSLIFCSSGVDEQLSPPTKSRRVIECSASQVGSRFSAQSLFYFDASELGGRSGIWEPRFAGHALAVDQSSPRPSNHPPVIAIAIAIVIILVIVIVLVTLLIARVETANVPRLPGCGIWRTGQARSPSSDAVSKSKSDKHTYHM